MIVERNYNYDLLRLLGLMVIMIAHSSPPGWLFQLRNFGTPLLVIGSALTYSYIFCCKPLDIRPFLKKRFTRLIFPLWFFLTFFFIIAFIITSFNKEFPFTVYQVVTSYFLFDGIGFVWVFKIYIFLALLTPLAIKFNKHVKSNSVYLSSIFLFYIGYEFLVLNFGGLSGSVHDVVINKFAFIMLPYALIYFYGFRLSKLSFNIVLFITLASLITFLAMLLYKFHESGQFIPTQDYKYPPTLYYFSYALFCINSLYLIIVKALNVGASLSKGIVWLSKNSLWIYLWHIAAFYIWYFSFPEPEGDIKLFVSKTLFLFFFSILIVHLQNLLVMKLLILSPNKKRFVSLIF